MVTRSLFLFAQPDIFSSLHRFFIYFFHFKFQIPHECVFLIFLLLATEKKHKKREMYEQINVEEKILRE